MGLTNRFCACLIGILSLMPFAATAENPVVADSVPELEKMVVTATRRETQLRNAPGISYVIDAKSIRNLNAAHPGDVLEYVPGLDIECGTGVGVPFKRNVAINGLPSFHNVVLVDGKRLLSSHFHTGANIDMVPAGNIERIEVIKDASSAQYGSDALGGVINIITRKGSAQPRLEFDLSGGSRKTARSGLSLTGNAGETIHHSTYAGWEQSDGLSITEGRRKDQLGFKQLTIMDKVDISAGALGRIGATMHYSRLFDMPLSNVPYDAWLVTPGVDFDINAAKDIAVSGQGYYSRWYAEQPTGQIPEKNEIASPSLWVTYSGIRANLITLGGEYAWRNFMRQGVQEKDQHIGGVFLQDEITMLPRLKVLGALRADYVDNTGENVRDNGPVVTPKISILYRPVDAFAVRAGAGTGFRAPYVQDLYESRYHSSGGGIWRYGNIGLKPEYSRSANAGVDWDVLNRFNLSANGFYNRLTDMIALSRSTRDSLGGTVFRDTLAIVNGKSTRVPVWERVNVNSYRIGGIEGMLAYRLKRIGVEVGASASWHRSDDPKAANILQYPGQKVFGKLTGDYPVGSQVLLNGFAGAQRVYNRSAPMGGGALKNYTNLEAGIGMVLMQKYDVYVKGKNLLGQQMQMYEDALWTVEGTPVFEGGIRLRAF